MFVCTHTHILTEGESHIHMLCSRSIMTSRMTLCKYEGMLACLCIYACIRTCTYMYMAMFESGSECAFDRQQIVRSRLCMYVCTKTYGYVHVYNDALSHTRGHIHTIPRLIPLKLHTYTYIHMHSYTYTQIPIYTQADTFSEVLGEKVVYNAVPRDVYASFGFPGQY